MSLRAGERRYSPVLAQARSAQIGALWAQILIRRIAGHLWLTRIRGLGSMSTRWRHDDLGNSGRHVVHEA